jgi:hypothetical protein
MPMVCKQARLEYPTQSRMVFLRHPSLPFQHGRPESASDLGCTPAVCTFVRGRALGTTLGKGCREINLLLTYPITIRCIQSNYVNEEAAHARFGR